jgi:hypothetical protein
MCPTVGFHVPNIRKTFVKCTSVNTRKDGAVKRQRGVKSLLHSFLALSYIRTYVPSFTALLLYLRRNAGYRPESVSKRWRNTPPPQQVIEPRISCLPVRVHSPMYAARHLLCSKTPSSRALFVDCVKNVAVHWSNNTEY